jgi:hypothetical protein
MSFASEVQRTKQVELLQKRIEAQEDYINGLRNAARKSLVWFAASSSSPIPLLEQRRLEIIACHHPSSDS